MAATQTNNVRFGTRIERFIKSILFGIFRLFIHVRKCTTVPRGSVHNILVIRQHNQLGDMLCVTPLLRALRKTYPEAGIALLAKPLNAEILKDASFLDEVIIYDKARFFSAPLSVWKFAKTLRKRKFDLILVPATVSMSVTSDVLAFLTGSRRRIGPGSLNGKKNLTGFLYNKRVDLDWRKNTTVHQTQRNLDIGSILVLDKASMELEMGLSADELEEGWTTVQENRYNKELVIGVHPGAAKIPNRWDALRFAEIANRCAELYGAYIIVTAGPNDDESLHEMMVNVPNDALVLHNKPIRYVASILAHCDLYITNDTGMMHVAAATGTPTLSLFGPTPPSQWAPPGNNHHFILGKDGDIQTISTEKVWSAVMNLLDMTLAEKQKRDTKTQVHV